MKRVLQQIGVYKKDALLCVGLTALEVVMEILLPFITARLLAEGLERLASHASTQASFTSLFTQIAEEIA